MDPGNFLKRGLTARSVMVSFRRNEPPRTDMVAAKLIVLRSRTVPEAR